MDFSNLFARPNLKTFGTIQTTDNVLDMTGAEALVYLALRKATYGNKRFLILTGSVMDTLMSGLKHYQSFKPIRKLINRIATLGIISLFPYQRHTMIVFNEDDRTKTAPVLDSQGAKTDPAIYISKRIKEESNKVPNVPRDSVNKSSFILDNTNMDNRMNEPSVKIIDTGNQSTKPKITNQYIKEFKNLNEFSRYTKSEQETIIKHICKAKARGISSERIDAYCRAIIFNKYTDNMKATKYKAINDVKSFSYTALFKELNIYHKIDNPAFPKDIRTQEEIANEQRRYEKEERKTLAQQVLKVASNVQDTLLTRLKHLKYLLKENFDALLAKAKQTVAKAKDYNPLFVPEFEAVNELYENISCYSGTA